MSYAAVDLGIWLSTNDLFAARVSSQLMRGSRIISQKPGWSKFSCVQKGRCCFTTGWSCFRPRAYVLDYLYTPAPFSDDHPPALICCIPHYSWCCNKLAATSEPTKLSSRDRARIFSDVLHPCLATAGLNGSICKIHTSLHHAARHHLSRILFFRHQFLPPRVSLDQATT